MDHDELPEGEQPLDDSQRIALLEKTQKLDRLLLISLGGVLLVMLASWITYAVILAYSDDATPQGVIELQQEVAGLEQQLASLKQQLASQPAASTTSAPAPSTDDPAVTRQVAKTLMGQERNFQQSLAALKLGMRDLAGMIPGSRSWLTYYQEALDVPLGESRARAKDLEAWEQRLQAAAAEAAAAHAATHATEATQASQTPEAPKSSETSHAVEAPEAPQADGD